GAIAADSVVLQADALHLLMDVLALGVSLFAMRLAVRRPTPRFTYGLRRAEPVAAIFSAALVLATTVFIVIEAIDALRGRDPPRAGLMLIVASGALVVNGLSAWLLHGVIGHAHPHDPDNPDDRDGQDGGSGHAPGHDDHHDHPHRHDHGPVSKRSGHALNLRGAWLHLVGDTLGALAALVAAVILRFWGQPLADPIAGFVVAAILVVGALRLGRDATLVLLEAAPPHLPVERIRAVVAETPGVRAVHDLHVWTLGAGHDAITVHVRTDRPDPSFGQRLSDRIRGTLGAEYVTVKVECVPTSTEEP
ncbi:MAG TPA: cation diffusion facilitator family transporter, partial [Polyangiaceae bacterium]|nr:cation diffusion facilitator family transporter [Polyangiaceae bacterium]